MRGPIALLLCVAGSSFASASAAGSLEYDLPANGWAFSVLDLASESPFVFADIAVRVAGSPEDTSVYVVPLGALAQHPTWLQPSTAARPVLLRGGNIDGVVPSFGGAEPGRVFVAVASSAPATIQLRYDFCCGVTMTEISRTSGTGAQVDVEVAAVGEAAALVAAVEGGAPGWVAVDVALARTHWTAAGTLTMDRDGRATSCRIVGAGAADPITTQNRTLAVSESFGIFGTDGGRATAALASAQLLGDARMSAASIPITHANGLRLAGEYWSEFGEVQVPGSGRGVHMADCTF